MQKTGGDARLLHPPFVPFKAQGKRPRPVSPVRVLYWSCMKYILASAVLLSCLISLPSLKAAEKQYEAGRIVDVEKKSHDRVLYYVGNTPEIREEPYYELSLQLNNFVYQCEYTPRHAADELPEGWNPGTTVQIKTMDKRHMLVRQPGGTELQLLIVKRIPGTAATEVPKPAPVQN